VGCCKTCDAVGLWRRSAVIKKENSANGSELQWTYHCGRKIFVQCVRSLDAVPRLEETDAGEMLVLTCYHCGEKLRLWERDLESGVVTDEEVHRNIKGARYI